ncbi:hypothetical protein ACRALDRAFT_205840 [Sodiomyces alcalophilus JCM 7366]|uniref:uncharacterized protein n=1 Tax=Sodiomyces alcalophilus JCM 7366 TaxID=591952 RepID=UPI0039B6430C
MDAFRGKFRLILCNYEFFSPWFFIVSILTNLITRSHRKRLLLSPQPEKLRIMANETPSATVTTPAAIFEPFVPPARPGHDMARTSLRQIPTPCPRPRPPFAISAASFLITLIGAGASSTSCGSYSANDPYPTLGVDMVLGGIDMVLGGVKSHVDTAETHVDPAKAHVASCVKLEDRCDALETTIPNWSCIIGGWALRHIPQTLGEGTGEGQWSLDVFVGGA